MYNQLIDLGFKQHEIDEMDITYHLELLGRRKENESPEMDDEPLYIDDVLAGL